MEKPKKLDVEAKGTLQRTQTVVNDYKDYLKNQMRANNEQVAGYQKEIDHLHTLIDKTNQESKKMSNILDAIEGLD